MWVHIGAEPPGTKERGLRRRRRATGECGAMAQDDAPAPALAGVLETALYVDNMDGPAPSTKASSASSPCSPMPA